MSEHIGIDFEYHTDARGVIDCLICACATSESGRAWRWWLRDGSDEARLKDFFEGYCQTHDVVLVCHALDLAEGRALAHLYGGLEHAPRLQWRDTFHEWRLLRNSFRREMQPVPYSYAAMCSTVLGIEIDTAEKAEMRDLCIHDRTAGYELAIMEYCLHDTQWLPQLAERTLDAFTEVMATRIAFRQGCEYDPRSGEKVTLNRRACEALLLEQAREILAFTRIASRGLPVSTERLRAVERAAPAEIRRMQEDFNKKFPGAYTAEADGSLHKNQGAFQQYMKSLVDALGADGDAYPRTPKGLLSTSAETLKKFFDHQENFGGAALHMQRMTTLLQGIATGEWTESLDVVHGVLQYRSLEPFGSATGRCQPKPSQGFVFGWAKSLYGVLEPPKGFWLVELDYSAEETAIQAVLCQDPAYERVYTAKDTYLWFCDQLGLIPHEDFCELSTAELKARYGAIRKKIKTYVLAWGYGAGAAHLAELAGVPLEQSRAWKNRLEKEIFPVSTGVKRAIVRASSHGTRYGGRYRPGKAFSTPDGWLCRTDGQGQISETAMVNWFFQGWGAYILRQLVLRLCQLEDAGEPFRVVATIHDAVAVVVREGDHDAIGLIRSTMQRVADELLEVPPSRRPFMRVGEPEIIRHGEPWCPEPEHLARFRELMALGEPTPPRPVQV